MQWLTVVELSGLGQRLTLLSRSVFACTPLQKTRPHKMRVVLRLVEAERGMAEFCYYCDRRAGRNGGGGGWGLSARLKRYRDRYMLPGM